jgi:hypothetical protein
VSVFRRSSAGAAEGKAQDSQGTQPPEALTKTKPAAEAGKGRPTPKRSEAEANRYRSVTGGSTSGRSPSAGEGGAGRRKLTPDEKAGDRAERNKRLNAMRRGEEWALGPRDRGPLRKLARDYVDAHRRPSEFYMYALLVLLVALLSHNNKLNTYVSPLVVVLIAVIVVDGFFIRRALHKLAAERFPSESTRGLTTYAVMRALQIRRFRTPSPRLKPGDRF